MTTPTAVTRHVAADVYCSSTEYRHFHRTDGLLLTI